MYCEKRCEEEGRFTEPEFLLGEIMKIYGTETLN